MAPRSRKILRQDGCAQTAKEPQHEPPLLSGADAAGATVLCSGARVLAGRASAAIDTLRSHVRPQAFELLAVQPVSLAGMSQAERDFVVITAVADGQGNEHPVSRFGDRIWNMAVETKAKNRSASRHAIAWPDNVPKPLVDDAKAALYCALRRGPHGRSWSASAVAMVGQEAVHVLRYLASLGLHNFGQVLAVHLCDYIATSRGLNLSEELAKPRRQLQPNSVRNRLEVVNLVWHFPMEVFHPLPQHPWGGDTFAHACGHHDDSGPCGHTGKTPVVPRSVQRALFAHCEACLAEADALLQARDAGKIAANSPELTAVRDAVLYLTQATSGMRNSESMELTSGCWRSELSNGVAFHWVRTREIKTRKGPVDYLIAPEAVGALKILQRYAEPLQQRLADEARWLEGQLRESPDQGSRLFNCMSVAEALGRLNHVREIGEHLFLGLDKSRSDHLGTGSRVEVMSAHACNYQLKTLARAAGTDWDLANHQCRRTFAYNVANSRLGRMGLVFLKWQLKHTSMSWTQLYASNPYQDLALYREMEDEQVKARVDLMEGWMQPDAPLSGGSGRKLMQTRATPVRDLEDLLLYTAEAVEVRSTGHAWCLSGTRGCHGQGVYDPAKCAGCSQAVIDRDQAITWQMIHLDNLSLAAITDCGPAVVQKAQRAIRRSEEVLSNLGVPLPTREQAETYAKTGTLP
ncbi:tyrosine-type recombinase/integrase [uncultured Azohydromonas sp.]|jgi:Phage integrase family.|uniref:tyrosine-type recombinase/integrase n=1 Tax=uncultured Azohydromonas sp. TaxID=487342 RepID=UPI002601AC4B|nr:tyrosine-type recombinase/integrase [uncultured Azohydromonas sp.]